MPDRTAPRLEPHGILAFDLYDPWLDMAREIGRWKLMSKATRPSDGAECRMYWMVERRDLVEQTVDYRRRYVVFKDGRPIEELCRTTNERWYFKHELVLLMEKAGFHDIEVKRRLPGRGVHVATFDHGLHSASLKWSMLAGRSK